jgi:ABC-2 type transport system permease protein
VKLFDITLKDLLQSTRTMSFWLFAFVVPVLVTLMFFIMFGSTGGDDENGFELPQTTVVIVNLDQGQLPASAGEVLNLSSAVPVDISTAKSMGRVITELLQTTVFEELMRISEEKDESAARTSVDDGTNDMVIILPTNFTDSLIQFDDPAAVQIYKDPTLTFGPAIVEAILRQLLDGFSSARIGTQVTIEQLASSGVPISAELVQEIVNEISALSSEQTEAMASGSENLIALESTSSEDEPKSIVEEIIGLILGGMMIFFAFFTGSAGMQSILVEEERFTLPRLFTTPTSHRTILSGKGLAAFITVAVQVTVLMLFGWLVFSIDWGETSTVILATIGIILVATATGLFIVSWLTNTRQSGIVFGGLLTLTGMIGLIGVFTAGVPNQPEFIKTMTLLVPQGWAMRGLTIALEGGTVQDLLPIFGGIMVWTVAFSLIGLRRMRTRYA